MAASDIAVSGLNKVGAEDAAYLVSKIRTIPGFPKEGILFRDFMPVLADARAFGILMGALEAALPVDVDDFDMVAGLEARGFLFGPALAARLGRGLSRSVKPANCLQKPCRKAMTSNMVRRQWKSKPTLSMRECAY